MSLWSISHTARKPHQCAECKKTINTGETYVRVGQPGKAYHPSCYQLSQPKD